MKYALDFYKHKETEEPISLIRINKNLFIVNEDGCFYFIDDEISNINSDNVEFCEDDIPNIIQALKQIKDTLGWIK